MRFVRNLPTDFIRESKAIKKQLIMLENRVRQFRIYMANKQNSVL